jgi:hypothetical protein
VNRDQWNVDDELSRLKDEIKNDMGQRRGARQGETTHYGPHQHIEGRGNVQVAGDLIFTTRKPIDPNHPDAIRCPKCKGMTYSFSELCYECNFNQKYYFIEQARKWGMNFSQVQNLFTLLALVVSCWLRHILRSNASIKFRLMPV